MSTAMSLAGTPAAKPLGYLSWPFGQGARDPYYILVIIYIFYPYFSNTVVGDPIRGQALIGYITAGAGFVLAITAPFLITAETSMWSLVLQSSSTITTSCEESTRRLVK